MVSECGTSEQSVKFVYGVAVERLSRRNGVYLCANKEHVEMSTANQKQTSSEITSVTRKSSVNLVKLLS